MKCVQFIIFSSVLCAMSVALATPPSIPVAATKPKSVDGSATITFDAGQIAKGVSTALPKPERFNFEAVKVSSIQIEGGAAIAEVKKAGDRATATIKGDTIFKATVTGSGDRKSKLHMVYTLSDVNAVVDLSKGQAEVDAVLRVQNHENTRMWTRAKNQRTSPWSRVTFRITAIPQPFDVKLRVRLLVKVEKDGSVILVPQTWTPLNQKDKIDVKISGQKLPDGWATISPLDVKTVKVDMDIPFGIGDRTIPNPLVHGLEKVMGREFRLGKLPK